MRHVFIIGGGKINDFCKFPPLLNHATAPAQCPDFEIGPYPALEMSLLTSKQLRMNSSRSSFVWQPSLILTKIRKKKKEKIDTIISLRIKNLHKK